jgi:hypothetical protein
LQEAEEEPISITSSQTTTPQNKVEKISRKEVSPSVTEVSAEDFLKRNKTISIADVLKEGEMQSTIVLEGPTSSTQTESVFVGSPLSPAS